MKHRYIATFIPQIYDQTLRAIMPVSYYPDIAAKLVKPDSVDEWDCTDYLNEKYTLAQIEEMLEDYRGSELTDSVRDDPNAPEWIRMWDNPFEVQVDSSFIVGGVTLK